MAKAYVAVMRKPLITGIVIALLAGVGYATRYDYVTANGRAVRINRFTGETETLREGRWASVRPPSSIVTFASMTVEQRAAYDRVMRTPLRPGESEWERQMRAQMAALPEKR